MFFLQSLFFSAYSQTNFLEKQMNSLIEAESNFANNALSKNIKTAFEEVLSSESIVFRPYPINGRWAYRIDTRPDTAYLFWRPEIISISHGGDFGYSTGPWYAKRSKQFGEVKGFGNFVTIWEKDKSGKWKVLLDKGVNYSKVGERKVGLTKVISETKIPTHIEIDSIMSIDSKLFGGKEEIFFNEETLILRHDLWPTPIAKLSLEELAKYTAWTPINGKIAVYGDMAYTYGKYEVTKDDGNAAGHYLRIFKKLNDQQWCIVLDLRTDD